MADISAITSDSNLNAQSANRTDLSFRQAPGPNMSDVGDATMSFGDFLDMINPLQHIPLASSIYRAASGETINPIARIAGDTLYGGIFGLASAGIGALGAVGDEVVAGLNGGHGICETVVAGLFGSDNPEVAQETQLAQADAPLAASQGAVTTASALQTPARQSPMLQTPDETSAQLAAAAAVQAPVAVAQNAVAQNAAAPASDAVPAADMSAISPATLAKAFPLDRGKAPYGGVMDTSAMQSAQQNQALAMAMAGQNNILAAQRQLRNSRFAVASPDAAKVSTTSVTAGNDLPPVQLDPSTQNAMQNMIKELQSMKGAGQYQNTAQTLPVPGAAINSTH